jgi:WD40 repeat protein
LVNPAIAETFVVWEKAAIVRTLEAHQQPITLLSFSLDGKWLASADARSLMIWEVNTGKLQRILPGHHSATKQMAIAPTSIALSPDGRLIASSTWSQGSFTPEKSIVVWETETGREVLSMSGKQGCRQVLFSPDGKKLLSSCGLGIQIWHLGKGKQLFSFANQKPVDAFTLSPDGQTIATAASIDIDATHPIELWQITDTEAIALTKLEGHSNEIAHLAFTNDGKKLVSSSYDGTIKLWNWQIDRQGRSLKQTSLNGLFSLSADGGWLAGNFNEGHILNLVTEQAILIDFPGKTSAVAFSPDGQILAWAGQSNPVSNPLIRLWQVDQL